MCLEFTSIFKDEIILFIKYKRSLGLKYKNENFRLHRIDNQLNELGLSQKEITPETFKYLSSRHEMSDANYHQQLTVLNHFCAFLLNMGYENIYTEEVSLKVRNNYIPTLYGAETLNKLFEKSNEFITDSDGDKTYRYWFGCAIILRLLYACGLRISEVINLSLNNINIRENYLKIYKSKNDKSRIVSMSDSMNKCLSLYLDLFCVSDDPIFVSKTGKRLSSDSFREYYHKLQDACGLERNRLHDLRHVFCNASLHQMMDRGYDLNTASVYLYKYMGHSQFSETEYYLHFTNIEADKIRDISSINDEFLRDILGGDDE